MLTRRAWPALIVAALVASSCGGGGGQAGSGGGPSLTIQAPADRDRVAVPFEVEFSTDATLGPPESGDNHIHLYYDGDESNYEVINGSRFVVSELSPGKHTLEASLRNADHSPVGVNDTITVTVAGGGGEPDGGTGQGNGGDGGGYGDY